jgi:hypothetical protein
MTARRYSAAVSRKSDQLPLACGMDRRLEIASG